MSKLDMSKIDLCSFRGNDGSLPDGCLVSKNIAESMTSSYEYILIAICLICFVWFYKKSRDKYKIGRVEFFIETVITVIVVILLGYVFATSVELRLVNYLIIVSGFLVSIIVFLRESDIVPRVFWRTWYTVIISFLLAFSVSIIYVDSSFPSDILIYKEAQASIGYFFFYLLLLLPILLSCLISPGKK